MKVDIQKHLKKPIARKAINGVVDVRVLKIANKIRKERKMTWDELLEGLLIALCESESGVVVTKEKERQ